MGSIPSECDYYALLHILKHELPARAPFLKTKSLQRAAALCLDWIILEARQQMLLLLMSKVELQALCNRCSSQNTELHKQVADVTTRVAGFIDQLIGEDLRSSLKSFISTNRSFSESCAENLDTSSECEILWSEFLNEELIIIRHKMVDITRLTRRMVLHDLKYLFKERTSTAKFLLPLIHPCFSSPALLPDIQPAYSLFSGLSLCQERDMIVIDLPLFASHPSSQGQPLEILHYAGSSSTEKHSTMIESIEGVYEWERLLNERVKQLLDMLVRYGKYLATGMYQQSIVDLHTALHYCVQRQEVVQGNKLENVIAVYNALPTFQDLYTRLHLQLDVA